MAYQPLLEHYKTFARLRRASPADLASVREFCLRAPLALSHDTPDWADLIGRDDSYVLVATECQLIVGIGVLQHAPSACEARLAGLFVGRDAVNRGVDQLILATLIGRARSEGAALLHAVERTGNDLDWVLSEAGFTEQDQGFWTFGLWNGHNATSYSDITLARHDPVLPGESPAQTLLLAMGALNASMLLTVRARQVLGHEITLHAQDVPLGAAMARAALHRHFAVSVHETNRQNADAPFNGGRVTAEEHRLTPERILGHLSRRHICLVQIAIPRLRELPSWYLITGFDGFLFRLHDVTQAFNPVNPAVVTAGELRQALGAMADQDWLAIGRAL